MKNIRILMMIISAAISTHLSNNAVEAAEQKDVKRYYHDEITGIGKFPLVISLDSAATSKAIEIRLRPEGRSRQPEWKIEWLGELSTWAITVAPTSNYPTEDLKEEGFIITTKQDGEIIDFKIVNKGINAGPGANSMLVEWEDKNTKLFFGSDRLQQISNISTSLPQTELLITCNGTMSVEELITDEGTEASAKAMTAWTEESITNYMKRAIKPEGVWEFLDRENDPRIARMGGRYTISLIKDNDSYLILYHEGAEINKSRWKTGMLKGRLLPTKFQGQYNLIWYDAMFVNRGDEGYATIDEDCRLLTIYFPILKATIRFTPR